MNRELAQAIIIDNLEQYGETLLVILGAVIVIGLGVIVFNSGYETIRRIAYTRIPIPQWGDRSMRIGGFYMWKTPWKGYNRWRSRSWNEKHTL